MGLKINRNEDDLIVSIQTNPGVFSYAFLLEPRPEKDLKAGTYGTDLIIRDKETIAAIKEYLNQEMKISKDKHWDGKTPKKLHLPLKKGDEDSELTKGAYVLKTSTAYEPKVLIRDPETGRAHNVDRETEADEIYSGMIGEIIVTFKGYNYSGNKGITAYITAACKTDAGTPLGNRGNYEEDFSLEGDFDESDFDEPTPKEDKKPKSSKAGSGKASGSAKAGASKKGAKKDTKKDEEVDIDSLIESDDGEAEEEEDIDVENLSVEDFMNE